MTAFLFSHLHYFAVIILFTIGLYAVIEKNNLVKKTIGLNIIQTSVFLFYISIAYVDDGVAPILKHGTADVEKYVDPLPHVLMLTAIVVGVSITAVALAMTVRIKQKFGTIEENEIFKSL